MCEDGRKRGRLEHDEVGIGNEVGKVIGSWILQAWQERYGVIPSEQYAGSYYSLGRSGHLIAS